MLNISEINPYIRVAMRSVLNEGRRIDTRIIFDYELIFIEDGELLLNYNGIDYNCAKGQFLFLRPGISHSFQVINNALSQPHIHFDMTDMPDSRQVPVCFKNLNALTPKEQKRIRKDILGKGNNSPFVTFSDTQRAKRLFYAVIDAPKGSELTQKGLLIQLIDMLIADNFCGVYEEVIPPFYDVEAQVKNFIDAGQGMTLSLDDIARQFGYSKYYLERRFKAVYGSGLMAYRNNKRLQLAKTLLREKSVSEVADILGFSSIYVFSRAIKNYYGVSPTELKR